MAWLLILDTEFGLFSLLHALAVSERSRKSDTAIIGEINVISDSNCTSRHNPKLCMNS